MPLVGFACGVLCAIVVALRFNLTTARYVRLIQIESAREGNEWPFWTNKHRLFVFVFTPQTLVVESDSPALRAAKQRLLAHRAMLPRRLMAAIGGAVAFIAAGLAIAIAVAALK